MPLLEPYLKDPRDAIRAFSIFGLGLIGLGNDAGAITAAAVGDPSGAVRIAAIDTLGRYEEAKHRAPPTKQQRPVRLFADW